ncbi:MAG: hypothetical protein ISR64_09685 [Deltaproteobacteria bacterium]|nr:hypothetical protein [Deltaproteobacteria bacterium]
MKKTLLLLALAMLAAAGCKKGNMAERQKQALDSRKNEIRSEVDQVLNGWLDHMVETLPADVKKYPKVKSSLVNWRLKTMDYDWRRPLGAAVVKARGTPFEAELKAIPEFFDQMELFWNKKIDFKDYMKAWASLKEASDDLPANLLADFDHTFVHLEAFYGAQDMDGDDRAIYFFRHWQVAFQFPREYHEAVSDYLARICKAKLSDYCRNVPFEVMHFAMERPYLKEAMRITGEFMDRYKDCKLNRVFVPFLADVKARVPKIAEFKEYPPVPETVSRSPYVGDLIFTVSRQGIDYEGYNFMDFSDGWTGRGGAWGSMSAEIDKMQISLEERRGPENLELMLVMMDKQAPLSIPARLVSMMKKHPARYITFGARRKLDGVNRKATLGRLEFREVPVKARNLDMEGRWRIRCKPLGQSDDSDDLPSKVRNVVFLGPDAILAGTLDGKRVKAPTAVDKDEALKRLATGVGLLAVDSRITYERFVGFIDGLFRQCEDSDCQVVKDLKPRLEVQVCSR